MDQRLDQQLQDEQGRLSALHRYEVLDTPKEAPFDRITQLVKVIFDVPMVAVSLIDKDRQWFKSCVGLGVDETTREVSFCTYTIQGREPMYIPDATKDPRFAENPLVTGEIHIRSYLGIPLTSPDGYNLGSLCVIDTKPRLYDKEQIHVLSTFASLVVDELELRRVAQTDHLTGALTRRGFLLEMEKALVRYRRNQIEDAVLLLLDIDHFKQINDTHGHPTGDTVLRTMAHRLDAYLRTGDSIGRLGGEEFGILLPGTSIFGARESADRLRETIAAEPLSSDPRVDVTASFGIANLRQGYEDVTAWLAAADDALYQAKEGGRNCCITVTPTARV